MYKKIFTCLLVIIFLHNVCAGDSKKEKKIEYKSGFAVAGHSSTNGFGGNLIYSVNKNFSIRGGYEKLKFNVGFDFDENDITYDANLNYKTGSISILADYNLLRIFYVTGGFGYHLMNSRFDGYAISDLEYGDISIPPEDIGDFDFTIKPKKRLAPYAGIGFGRIVGYQKAVAFNLEFGAFYLGGHDVELEASGLLSPTADPAHGQEELFESQLKRYSFYPVVKIGLSVKLF
ncbi:MAG: hypothetical protein JW833_00875 [Prolixibacteraceae bacterium]|nr:hypothetical protein [Prolixibacteraceae bacterium]